MEHPGVSRDTLAQPTVHRQWASVTRTPRERTVFTLAFDYIARTLSTPQGSVILDAGCVIANRSTLFNMRTKRNAMNRHKQLYKNDLDLDTRSVNS